MTLCPVGLLFGEISRLAFFGRATDRPDLAARLSQYEKLYQNQTPSSINAAGERRLWCFVLMQAICDLAAADLHGGRFNRNFLQRSAREWFTSNREDPGDFIWLCGQLELDPDAVRDRLLKRPFHLQLAPLDSSDAA